MQARKARWTRAGFGVVEAAFVALCAVLLVIGVGTMLSRAGASVSSQARYHAESGAFDTLVLRWRKEAQTAMAVFVPGIEDPSNATDVLGRTNGDGHAFDYYFKDAAGTGRFVEYLYDGTGVSRYEYATWAGRVGGARQTGQHVPAAAFSASYLHAYALGDPAANPNGAPFIATAAHPAPTEKLVNLGFPGVEAGNRLVKISLATTIVGQTRPQEIHLLAVGGLLNGGQPASIRNGSWRPPAYPLTTSNGGAMTFDKQWAAPQSFNTGEAWYRGGYTLVYDSCGPGGVAAIAKTATGGTADSTGTFATWTVAPDPSLAADASCLITIQDDVGQQTSESISVHHRGPVSVSPATLHFNSPAAQAFTASEVGCDATHPCPAFSMAPQSGNCGNFAFTGSSPTWSASPLAYNGSSCVVVVYDERGPGTGSATVSIDVTTFSITVVPTSVAAPNGQSASWTASSNGADGSHANVQITNGRAGAGGGSCAGWTPAGMSPSPTTFSVTVLSGQCLVDVVDDRGSTPVTVTINGIPPTPTPIPFTPPPTAAPTPGPTPTPGATPPPYLTCVDGGGATVAATFGYFYTVPNPANGNRCTMVVLFGENPTPALSQQWFAEPSPGTTDSSQAVIQDWYPYICGTPVGSTKIHHEVGPGNGGLPSNGCNNYRMFSSPFTLVTNWAIFTSFTGSGMTAGESALLSSSGYGFNDQVMVTPDDPEAQAYVSLLGAGTTIWTNPCRGTNWNTQYVYSYDLTPATASGATYDMLPPDGTPTVFILSAPTAGYPSPCTGAGP